MVEVHTKKDVFSQGGRSVELRRNENFLILNPVAGPGGQDVYIVRNSNGAEGEVLKRSLGNLILPEWFQMVDRTAAETHLKNSLPGSFVIRPTTRGKDGEFSVSVKYKKRGDVHHFKLIKDSGQPTWTMWGKKFKTLQEFIKTFQKKPIAKKGTEQITLVKNADVEVLIVEDSSGMDTYYDGQDAQEETYDNGSESENEDSSSEENEENHALDDIEGSVVTCIDEFIAEEEGTISMEPGDRLLVLYPPDNGWVYVRNDRGEDGYVPQEFVEFD